MKRLLAVLFVFVMVFSSCLPLIEPITMDDTPTTLNINKDIVLPAGTTVDGVDISTIAGAAHAQNTDTNMGVLPAKPLALDADKFVIRDSAAADIFSTTTGAQLKTYLGGHTQNTDWTLLNAAGGANLINNGVLVNDLKTDRWVTASNTNTLLGINVVGNDDLAAGGVNNTAIGYDAIYDITTGFGNTAVGSNSLENILDGYYNTAVGNSSLSDVSSGTNNTAVGELAGGYISTGSFNTAVGSQALLYNNGNYNTALGQWAGDNNTGSSNVFLGYSAGQDSGAVSNKLYIANSNDATPLIYGDFSTDTVTINNDLSMAGDIIMTPGATVDGVDISTLSGTTYANTFTISPSGANYTTIQAALTANPTANTLFLVYPGTYTNDTINFTANGQSVKGMGTYAKQIVTSASAAVVDFGAYTGCSVTDMTVRVTAATSAIATVNGSTGTIFLYDSAVEMTNSNVATAAQPCCIKTTGAATVTFINGLLNYTNNVATTAGAGIKTAVCPALNSTTTFRRAAITIAGAGASELIIPIYGELDCTTQFYRCRINVTDLDTTAAIGFSYISGAGGTGENYSNTCYVTCGAGAGHEADGLIAVGTRNIRSMFNYIALSGNTQYPFQVDSGCTVESGFDDIVSTGASLTSGTGVFKYINSITDGSLKVSGNISVGENITMAAGKTVDGVDISGHASRHQWNSADSINIIYNFLSLSDLALAQGLMTTSTISGAGGSAYDAHHEVDLTTGAVSGNYVGLLDPWSKWFDQYGIGCWSIYFRVKTDSAVTNMEHWSGWFNDATTYPTATVDHIGVKLINQTLSVTNANGGVETATQIATGVGTYTNYYFLIYNRTDNSAIDYYWSADNVNWTLVTHSTNIPADQGLYYGSWLKTTSNNAKRTETHGIKYAQYAPK